MSDNYEKRYKTSRLHKEKQSVKSRTKHSSQKHPQESRTPPLPTKSTSTLEELLKKRDCLKNELKKIVKHSDSETSINRKREPSRSDYPKSRKIKKYDKYENDRKYVVNAIHNVDIESSPELDHTHIESEDEETIIERQRQQRKKLLEKFNVSAEKDINNDDIHLYKRVKENKQVESEIQKISRKVTDMFSEKDEFENKTSIDCVTQGKNDPNLTDNWDDADGYYNIKIGDVLHNKYTIKSVLGQGVFATVVRAQDISDGNNYFAIKIVRQNHLMYKTSLREIAILKEIRLKDPENKYHCVQLFGHFMHRGHLCIVLESLHMDLRSVIKKYGRQHGLNITALMSYSRQLLLALKLIKKLNIIHADIKPDNILINEKKNLLKLCDFGSATKIDNNELTPYLVSRFYRAPEIILGMNYHYGVDIWSTACTMYEMATGKILFTGNTNNKMLKCFMELKGPFSKKLIRKGKFKDQHFNYNNNFLLHTKDELTGRDKVIELTNITPSRDLLHDLKKGCKNTSLDEERKLIQLKDLLDKMTMLDASQRISVADCLKHNFISDAAM